MSDQGSLVYKSTKLAVSPTISRIKQFLGGYSSFSVAMCSGRWWLLFVSEHAGRKYQKVSA